MGTYENFYLNKIKKLQEENTQLKNLLSEMEQAVQTPSGLPSIIPTPDVSSPTSPERGYNPFDPNDPNNLSPYKPSPQIKPRPGPWRVPTFTTPITPGYNRPLQTPSPYR
jgi:PAB1-binding protein PBP1